MASMYTVNNDQSVYVFNNSAVLFPSSIIHDWIPGRMAIGCSFSSRSLVSIRRWWLVISAWFQSSPHWRTNTRLHFMIPSPYICTTRFGCCLGVSVLLSFLDFFSLTRPQILKLISDSIIDGCWIISTKLMPTSCGRVYRRIITIEYIIQ